MEEKKVIMEEKSEKTHEKSRKLGPKLMLKSLKTSQTKNGKLLQRLFQQG